MASFSLTTASQLLFSILSLVKVYQKAKREAETSPVLYLRIYVFFHMPYFYHIKKVVTLLNEPFVVEMYNKKTLLELLLTNMSKQTIALHIKKCLNQECHLMTNSYHISSISLSENILLHSK